MAGSIAALLLATPPLLAQQPSPRASTVTAATAGSTVSAIKRAAEAALTGRLSVAALRRLHCATTDFADCPGGIEVVGPSSLGSVELRGDTARVPVVFPRLGTVASSEAELMFLPAHSAVEVDSGVVTLVRRGSRWVLTSLTVEATGAITSGRAARRFFELEAEDRARLDSAIATHARPR